MEKFELNHWDDFLGGKIYVNCPTEALAKEFLEYCEGQGLKWRNDSKPTSSTEWGDHKENTCYDCITYGSKGLGYGRKKYYLKEEPCMTGLQFQGFTTTEVKPPLDLKPRKLWAEEVYNARLAELGQAIARYAEARQAIPYEWLDEIESLRVHLKVAEGLKI